MTDRISLALVFHNHQPVGNFGWVIADVYERAYRPMLDALERHPRVRLALHYTGPLLDWIRAERPHFLDRLSALVERGQVELLGGGYYEPVLAILPERDRIAQLERMADEVERIGGRRPAGAWLAERVWEPDLPTSIVDAGYRWTVLDDTHFRAAGLDDKELWGPYTTEDQGRLLTIFGSAKRLRYGIPFGRVEDLVGHLVANGTPGGERLGFMGDDGEKFGAWPDTYEHCWGVEGWVDRFFRALEAEPVIETVTPTDWLAGHRPIGRLYVPTSSYSEMGEWALPADQGVAFAATVRTAEAEGAPWARWLRGGFWRNFLAKYREINDLHKQMLRASAAVEAMPAGPAAELARRHLYEGQSNDCYWHGVFGGIYIPHMRLATHEHLIAAADIAELVGFGAGGDETEAAPRAALVDTDLDGIDEILASTAGQVAVIDPNEGGGLGSWDILAVRHALTAVMRRRPEAYHTRLLAHEASLAAAAAGTPREVHDEAMTIHDIVRSRETGLTPHLHYDAYERRSGLVHLLAPETTAAAFAHGSAVELGDAVRGEYELVELEPDRIVLVRTVAIEEPEAVVRIEKRFALGGDRRQPTLDLTVDVELVAGGPIRFDLALEWSLTMLGGGRNPAAYYRVGGERLTHDSIGERSSLAAILSGNDYIGVALETSVEPPATTWWAPIETISNSEYGFERVYQGSALTFVWPMTLAAGERRTVSVRNVIATAVDRSAEELAGPKVAR